MRGWGGGVDDVRMGGVGGGVCGRVDDAVGGRPSAADAGGRLPLPPPNHRRSAPPARLPRGPATAPAEGGREASASIGPCRNTLPAAPVPLSSPPAPPLPPRNLPCTFSRHCHLSEAMRGNGSGEAEVGGWAGGWGRHRNPSLAPQVERFADGWTVAGAAGLFYLLWGLPPHAPSPRARRVACLATQDGAPSMVASPPPALAGTG